MKLSVGVDKKFSHLRDSNG